MTIDVVKYCLLNNCNLIFTSTSDVYGNSINFDENEKITIGLQQMRDIHIQCQN